MTTSASSYLNFATFSSKGRSISNRKSAVLVSPLVSLVPTTILAALILVSFAHPALAGSFNANLLATPNPNQGNYTISWTQPITGTVRLLERPASTGTATNVCVSCSSPVSFSNKPVDTYEYWLLWRWAECTGGGRDGCTYYNDTSETIVVTVTNGSVGPEQLTYIYDALGRLTNVQSSTNPDQNYQYDDAGNRTTVTTNQ